MRRCIAALVAAALVLLTPGLAEAAPSSSKRDPQGDVIGGSGLDMRQVKLTKKGAKVTVTFTTWNAFADEDLAFPGGIGIDFKLGKKLVRGAAVRHKPTGVYGEICSYRQGPAVPRPKQCSSVAVSRVSDTAYRMTIPLKKIDRGAKRLSWLSSSMATNGAAGCTSGFCMDGVGKGGQWTTWRL